MGVSAPEIRLCADRRRILNEASAMAAADLDHLRVLVDEAARGLPDVSSRRMFGCHALFAGKAIFALVWKGGRIGVRLPDRSSYDLLMQTPGASPWTAGTRTMSHWVLVPESFHADPEVLQRWVAQAHAIAISDPSPPGGGSGTKSSATPGRKKRGIPRIKDKPGE